MQNSVTVAKTLNSGSGFASCFSGDYYIMKIYATSSSNEHQPNSFRSFKLSLKYNLKSKDQQSKGTTSSSSRRILYRNGSLFLKEVF